MTSIHIVAGGQFGSEGKGAFTAALVRKLHQEFDVHPTLVRVAGPNAGHTAYDDQGRKWSLRQIPVGAVVDHESDIIIGQQSEIDLEVIRSEIDQLEEAGISILDRLSIDHACTVIESWHQERELTISTGTTGKGIGGARAARLMRTAGTMRDLAPPDLPIGDTVAALRATGWGQHIVIEGTQGYGLGLHTSYYPYVTSSNTRCGDFLAMTGIQPWEFASVYPWLVFRAHPIRIAGNSGPLEAEITWEEVGQPTEFTTVTKKPRRVAAWDPDLAQAALRDNGAPKVNAVFTFADYLEPMLSGATERSDAVDEFVRYVEESLLQHPVRWIGTGPQTGVWMEDAE